MAAEGSLSSMVLNYQCMLHIFVQLRLSQELDAPFIAMQAVTWTGGLILSAGDVVKEFGWSTKSFRVKHKRVWNEWVEDAATREWDGPPPSVP